MSDEYGFKPNLHQYPPAPTPSYPAAPSYPHLSTPSYPPAPMPSCPSYQSPPHHGSHHHPPPTNYSPNYYPPPPSNSYPNVAPPHLHGGSGNPSDKKAYSWIDWNVHRTVPPTAVRGGVDKDGSQIYVGRAYHNGDWIPAKVIPDRHVAYVAHAGGEHTKENFQLLCEQRFDWVPACSGNIPPGAVEGGRTESGEPLYIGRVWHDGANTVGKVHPSHGCCYIPYDSREMSFSDYEILVLRC
ncbi:carboxypeptidase Y-like [Photinus pyralis]|uniref:carboxypeptidase Y-like n=1 Tax=Photinus pyralis TaxID=7054 RepID=UPI001266E661|nr:carboxypeptidase Y-like [Photinus pyralis]